MPGTTLLFDSPHIDPESVAKSRDALAAMRHYPSYSSLHTFQDDHLLLGCATFPGYPLIEHTLDGRYLVRLEGVIYGESPESIRVELRELCRFMEEPARLEERIVERVRSWDGEYLVVLYDTLLHRLVVFNDSLGRLPTYYRTQGRNLLLAREVKYIVPFMGTLSFDRAGLMQYLLFGSALGSSTLIEGVYSLPAGAILSFAPGAPLDLREHGLFLRPTGRAARTRASIASSLAESFLHGIKTRATALTNCAAVVSLSGGLDSRAVLAGLCRLGNVPRAVTMPGPEAGPARSVAVRFGAELDVLAAVDDGGIEDYTRYVAFKDGLDCHPGLPRLHRFMEELLKAVGPSVAYFTGIMGGEITRHYNVTSGLPSTEAVAEHLLRTKAYYKYSSERVGELMGMAQDEMLGRLMSLLEGFAPEDPAGKYLAFRHEFYRRYTGEAEDRNRYYCWSLTPFYSLDFYRQAMQLDEGVKGLWLWRDVLHCIDPRATADRYFNRGISLESRASMLAFSTLERLVRVAPIKRAAQGLFYVSSVLWERMRGSEEHPLKRQVAGALGNLRLEPPFSSRVPEVLRGETDPLGLERMLILSCYARAVGLASGPAADVGA